MGTGCTVQWPGQVIKREAGDTGTPVTPLRPLTGDEVALSVQRKITERLLLSALREHDAAAAAETSRRGSAFLAEESRRLDESLDEAATLSAMAGLSLPHLGAWCIVDTLDGDGTMRRVAMVHPDPAKQALLNDLNGRWVPGVGDGYGIPAVVRSLEHMAIADNLTAALSKSAPDPHVARVLEAIGIGALLSVPLVVRRQLVGAVTYVGRVGDPSFTPADLELARELTDRSAMALDRARLYGEAVAMRSLAETASQAKSIFLGMVSHELRTPLNAIGGYVDLLDLEIDGPITASQRLYLSRIRTNQRYLAGLISDLLNFTKVGSGKIEFTTRDVLATEVIDASLTLVDPLITERGLTLGRTQCAPEVVICGDRERIIQILVNLLSNAIKFTPVGGVIRVSCVVADGQVRISVTDTGIGIPADKLEAIFEPFMQVKNDSLGSEAGIGIGLAISRGLAVGMEGDLSAESTLGSGSRFTLTLPRSAVEASSLVPSGVI